MAYDLFDTLVPRGATNLPKQSLGSKSEKSLFKTLKAVEWDFADAKTDTITHSFHPYPAKFIPQIPRIFIEHFTNQGETVYDPFMGSGTTCVEANILGRNAIGNDINELAVLISKVKTTSIDLKRLCSIDSLLVSIFRKVVQRYENKNHHSLTRPKILNLDMWFHDFVIDELTIIKDEIMKLPDQDVKDLCSVAFSSIIVNVSRQDSDTRYVRVEKRIKEQDVFKRFSRQMGRMKNLMSTYRSDIERGTTIVKVADTRIRGIFPKDNADLVITSPPYPNAYDYHLYHKYRLFWLEMDPHELRRNEIGAHAHYSKKNGSTAFDFMQDMIKSFNNISGILKSGKYLVLVIGDSILKGKNIKNNELLKNVADETPFEFVDEYVRNLNLRKKSFNPKIGNIKTEKILIFKNRK